MEHDRSLRTGAGIVLTFPVPVGMQNGNFIF